MHVLGLPPAFVLSQDQTLRLKVRYWFLAWRLIQGFCVTGTFTLDRRSRLPRTTNHGDGLETQYRQSLVSFAHSENGTETRQDSAACVSLPSINLSKSAVATETANRPANRLGGSPAAMRNRFRIFPEGFAPVQDLSSVRKARRTRRPHSLEPFLGIGHRSVKCKIQKGAFFLVTTSKPQFWKTFLFM